MRRRQLPLREALDLVDIAAIVAGVSMVGAGLRYLLPVLAELLGVLPW